MIPLQLSGVSSVGEKDLYGSSDYSVSAVCSPIEVH